MGDIVKLSDMQRKDIILLSSGKKIGKIIDAEIEANTGRIISLLIEKKNIKNIFSGETYLDINFNLIKKIGEDVILIDILE